MLEEITNSDVILNGEAHTAEESVENWAIGYYRELLGDVGRYKVFAYWSGNRNGPALARVGPGKD